MSDKQSTTPPSLAQEGVIEDLDPISPPAPPPTKVPATNISQDDLEFIQRVFSQVEHVDFRTPSPASKGRLTGIDKKLFDLREQVRRLERELARVGFIWAQKQEELLGAAATVQAKGQEVQQANNQADNLRAEVASKDSHINKLESEVNTLQEELGEGKKQRLQLIEQLEEIQAGSAKALSAKENELMRSRNAYDALKELSHGQRETSREQLLAYRLQNDDLRDRLAALELQSTTRMRDSIAQGALRSELQQQLKRMVDERAEQDERLEELQNTAQQNLQGSQSDLSALSSQNEKLASELKQAQATSESLRQELSVEKEISQTNSASLTSQRQDFQADLGEARAELERATGMAESYKSAQDRLRSEFETKQKEQLAAADALRSELRAAAEEQARLTEELRLEKEAASSQTGLQEQSAETIDSLQNKVRGLEERLSSSTLDLKEKTESVAALEHRHQELNERLRLAERDKSTLAQRVGQLEAT